MNFQNVSNRATPTTTTDYFNTPTQTIPFSSKTQASLHPRRQLLKNLTYRSLHSAQCTVHSATPTSFASLLTLSKYPIVFSFSVPRSIQRQTPHYLSYLVLTKSRLNIKVLNNSYQQGKDERARWNVKSSISQLS